MKHLIIEKLDEMLDQAEVCSLYIDDIYNYAEEIEVVAYMPEPTPESYP